MNGNSVAVLEQADYLGPIINNIVEEKKYKTYDFKFNDNMAKGENFMGEVKRATLSGTKTNNEKETLKLIVKSVHAGNVISEIFTKNEVYAYETIHPLLKKIQDGSDIPEQFKFKFVQCYGTSLEPKKETLVLKDLNVEDFVMVDRLVSLDYDHLMLVLKNMATLHALGFAAVEKLPDKQLVEISKNTLAKEHHDMRFYTDHLNYGKTAISVMDSEENKSVLSKFYSCSIEDFIKRFDGYVNFGNEFNTHYLTLSHGDFWTNNFLFKYKDGKLDDMYVIDWQMVRFTSPVIDITYLVYFCMDEETREKYWDEILDTYYKTLGERLKQLGCDVRTCYPEAKFRTDLPNVFGYGLAMCMMLLPLFMSKKEDAKDTMGDLWDGESMNFKNVKYSDICIKRLNGIVRHYRQMGCT